jgi:colanic acid/amylovoran biosynthesis glycosyltransferase
MTTPLTEGVVGASPVTRPRGRPVRVAHSFPDWLPPTQIWLYNLVRSLPADIETHVLCERVLDPARFRVERLDALREREPLRSFWGRGLRRLGLRHHLAGQVRAGRRAGSQLWHSHFGHVAWADLGVVRRLGIPHVATFYGIDVNKLPVTEPRWRERYHELFARVDRVLCEGPHMARCVEALGCPPGKLRVQHLGIDIPAIPFVPRTWTPDQPLRVLVAASFREKKGIPDAVRAVGAISREMPVELTIIGDAGASADEQRQKALILHELEASGLTPVTRRLGYQPSDVLLAEAYRHHVFLSPSRTASDGDTEGGAPVSIIEMAASGMPVVATTHCDIPEVLEHGESGLLAAEGDVDALAAHLRRLAASPGAWLSLATCARRHIEREFDLAVQGRRLAELYRELTAA